MDIQKAIIAFDQLPSEQGGRIMGRLQDGTPIELSLRPSDVHDPSELPNYLAGYKPFGFRADEVSPPILVDKEEDKYRTFSSDDAFRRVTVKRSLLAEVPEVDPSSSLTNYLVDYRFIGSYVPAETEAQADNFSPLQKASKRCANAIWLDREIDVWTLLGTNTNWAATQRTAAAATWDAAGSDPIKDIHLAWDKSTQEVTGFWLNRKVANAFIRNTNVRDHMRQTLGDGPASSYARGVENARRGGPYDFEIPGLPPIHVSGSKVKNETTSALDHILGDVGILVTVPPGVPTDGEEISSSYTFRLKGQSGNGWQVRTFYVDNRGPSGGEFVVVSMADIAKFTGNTVGGIITGVHS